MKNVTTTMLFVLIGIGFSSCSDSDNVVPVNEEEVITTVITTLTGGGQTVTLQSRDLDGDGPNAPTINVSGNLIANTTYTGTVEFLNELVTPADDITIEVEEEGIDHQLFFQPTPASIGTFTYTDTDANGNPIGLQFTLITGNAVSGNVVVTLRHEPNKSASGVATGNIANAGGNTDAEVSFPVIVN
jgi:hypothetical protein